jgi:hypothetical protein
MNGMLNVGGMNCQTNISDKIGSLSSAQSLIDTLAD